MADIERQEALTGAPMHEQAHRRSGFFASSLSMMTGSAGSCYAFRVLAFDPIADSAHGSYAFFASSLSMTTGRIS